MDVVLTYATDSYADTLHRGWFMPVNRLLAHLLTAPEVGRLIVADPFRSAPIRLARRLTRGPAPTVGDGRRVTHVRPLRIGRDDPKDERGLRRVYRAYDGRLERAAGHGGPLPTVITCNPFVAAFSPLGWAGRVVYYGFDDWASYPVRRAWWPAYERAYEVIRERGWPVITVSRTIDERIAPRGRHLVLPNGVEADEWAPPWAEPPALPGGTPRIVYIGSIDDRVDLDALEAVARGVPGASVLMVGPVLDDAVGARLTAIEGVHLVGRFGRAESVAILRSADACVLPHRVTDLTRAMSPLKLYEYLAAGRPVAATALPPVLGVHESVQIVEPGGDFAAAVRAALARGPLEETERARFVEENSWSARLQGFLDFALAD